MFDAPLRGVKDRVGEPLAARLNGVSPNIVTVMGFGIGLLAAASAVLDAHALALALWLISRALDGLDGLVARLHGRQSDFGGYLDILLDFGVYAAVPIGLVLGAPSPERYVALALMLATFYVNAASWMMLSAILEKRRWQTAGEPGLTTVVMPAGLIGAMETILAYCAFLIWPDQVVPLFIGFSVLVWLTILQRLVWAWRRIR